MPLNSVKIDLAGEELDVLRGMTETMHTSRPAVICELDRTWAEVVALLESLPG
jgi:hypothetical protein